MDDQVERGIRPQGTSPYDQALALRAARDWEGVHALLQAADARGELDAAGLELLSDAARWTGRDQEIVAPLERAHAAFTAAKDAPAAARTALGLVRANMDHRRDAVASTWMARAAELLEGLPERSEHGWLACFRAQGNGFAGDGEGQRKEARAAHDIARRTGDRGLEAVALMELAHVAGAIDPPGVDLGLAERAAAIVLAGEAGLLASGDVLCSAIWLSRSRGAWDRAQQWIDASDRMLARERVEYFPGMCRVHRAEVLRVRGKLEAAERESLIAVQMLDRSLPSLTMLAYAELGEVRRRRGDADSALDAFGRALQLGWDPQPGMALALLASGHGAEAMRAIERVFRVPPPTLLGEDRANLLGARTTVALANDDVTVARAAADALGELSSGDATAWDQARCAEARGRVELATNGVERAIDQLTHARRGWTHIDAPFELATTCVLLGDALERVGDERQAQIVRSAGRELFGRIGALGGGEGSERRLAGLPPRGQEIVVAAGPRTLTPARASLTREGEYWSIEFGGSTLRVRHGRGIQYLADLLARPGESIWALELAAAPEDGASASAPDAGGAGPRLDARARREYAARLRELEDELDDARSSSDAGRVEAARAEMDALGRELAAAVGLFGSDRKSGAAERARQSVTKALRAVVKRIGVDHAGLGEHLDACVRTGTACTFLPDRREPIVWTVRCGGGGR